MDHRLKVFKEVALTKSFTQAAQRLNLSQPAVSKTIKKLEEEYDVNLFERKESSIALTESGVLLLKYTEKILGLYRELQEELSGDQAYFPDTIYFGASTSIANYIIPKLLAKLQKKKPKLNFHLISGNTNKIQRLILNKELNMGVVEGHKHNSRLAYKKLIKDELVLVAGSQNKLPFPNNLKAIDLQNYSFVEREYGSGTQEVIQNSFANLKVPLPKASTILGSTESIKSYLQRTDSLAFLSIHAVSKELLHNQLKIIELDDLSLFRWFYFITRQGYPSKLSDQIYYHFKDLYNQTE